VFRLLYNHVENLAKESQILSLRLYVERDNTIAKNTYQKLGMNLSHYDMFEKKSWRLECTSNKNVMSSLN